MEDEPVPYNTISLTIGEGDADLAVVCRGLQLYITINVEDLSESEGEEDIRRQFLNLLGSMDDDPNGMENLADWMMLPCVSHIEQDTAPRITHSTLQSYYHAKTLVFALVESNKHLEAKPLTNDPSSQTRHLLPSFPKSERCVTSAIENGLPCIPASEITIIRDDPDMTEWDHDELPKAVQTHRIQGRLFFKAATEKGSFRRELTMLLRIPKVWASEDLRTSRLAGLVQWDNESSIAGLLIEYMSESKTLDWAAEDASRGDRLRWGKELRQTVEELHDHDIVWGDVKPQNVLIDSANRVRVIDFGGGFSEDWVDRELEDSKDGDLQGVARIQNYLDSF